MLVIVDFLSFVILAVNQFDPRINEKDSNKITIQPVILQTPKSSVKLVT
jgi:hypothetical protein